jgi:predicted RNA binding protein YcfA (HicA-like mRNA interferase family)
MTANEVIKRILGRGGRELRQKGSHVRLECACGRNKTTVPVHGGDLGRGLLGGIEKDLEPCFGKRWLLGK